MFFWSMLCAMYQLTGAGSCVRSVIWGYPRWNVRHLSQVVCGEHFLGWHQSFWMEAVASFLKRLMVSTFNLSSFHMTSLSLSLWMQELCILIFVAFQVDVFSFGIVMWELLTGEEPYADLHYGAIIGNTPPWFNLFSPLQLVFKLKQLIVYTFRRYCEQYIAPAGARILRPRMEITDGEMLVVRDIRKAKFHRDREWVTFDGS